MTAGEGRSGLGLRSRAAAFAVLFVLGFWACRAQEGVLDDVYPCNPSMNGNDCGTKAGKPMKCFAAEQLGGTNFCAEACDPAVGAGDPTQFVCTPSGARLKVCHPAQSRDNPKDPSLGCPSPLQCYRTDLLIDVGLCIWMPVCTNDSDCPDQTNRPICAGRLIRDLKTQERVNTDNLQCLRGGCKTASTACAGEMCAGDSYGTSPAIDDICVPGCDSDLHCPPNFTCAKNLVWAPGSPRICMPGLPGLKCAADGDCIAGSCVDIGVEFKVCAYPQLECTSDADCAGLNNVAAQFVCAGGPPGVCATLGAFYGPNCTDFLLSTDCPTGLICSRYSPTLPVMSHGECRKPCDPDGGCLSRGGVPHVCVGPKAEGGCYPGSVGMPCQGASDCIQGLSCMAAPEDPRSLPSTYSSTICTAPCASDQECDDNPVTHSSFCSCGPGTPNLADGSCPAGTVGICRYGGWDNTPPEDHGAPCERDAQCVSRNCDPMNGTCAAAITP